MAENLCPSARQCRVPGRNYVHSWPPDKQKHTIIGPHSVLLGMASARDIGSLKPAQLAILDAGLVAIARRLIPSTYMYLGIHWPLIIINLFSSVSLQVMYPTTNSFPARTEFVNFRIQQLNDLLLAWRSEGDQHTSRCRLVSETLYQLIQFRGIILAYTANKSNAISGANSWEVKTST